MTAPKKYILQLCHGYTMPFLEVAKQYATLFDETNYHVITVYLTRKEDNDVATQSSSEHVIFLNNKSSELRGLKRKQIRQLKYICSQYYFEFAIAHRYKAIYILSHIKTLPVIGVHHAFGIYQRFMRRYYINRHQQNLYLLGVSNAIRDEIRRDLPKFPQQQIQTLYNGINVEHIQSQQLDSASAKNFLGLDKESYVFANVGRLHADKDQKTLISAFANIVDKCTNAVLIIIGHGDLDNDLKDQVRELDLEGRVLFLGVIPNAVKYFRAFDTFVLTSYLEPFGIVLLEAIVSKLPIISSKTGGAKEIICNPQCLFDIGNTEQLSQKMQSNYFLDSDQKIALSAQNTQWLEQNFTYNMVNQTFWSLPFMKEIHQ